MSPPSVYLFYGDNPLAISETIAELEAKLGPSSEFSVQRLSGRALDLEQLRAACGALPFLSIRRLIVVEQAERIPDREPDRFVQLMDELPDTAALVLIEEIQSGREREYKKVSFLHNWAQEHPEKSYVRAFMSPKGSAFIHWLSERSKGRIDQDAAQLLSHYVEEDTLLAEQELQKLLNYVNDERPIAVEDVERLTPSHGQLDIFAVVDKLGDTQGTLPRLQRLLEDQDLAYVFLMLVRQFRLMILARRAIEIGEDPIASMNVPPFVARKVSAQSQQFTTSELKGIYQRLLDLDVSVKRGEADLSLDLLPLVASLS
ncbi:MAG: DNA polymerase III subunit delta [Anaerolineales bacterium]